VCLFLDVICFLLFRKVILIWYERGGEVCLKGLVFPIYWVGGRGRRGDCFLADTSMKVCTIMERLEVYCYPVVN